MGEALRQPDEARDSIWSAPFVVLTVANFFLCLPTFMSNTVLPVYLDELGAGAFMVGVVAGAFVITALVLRPFAGPAFDSFPRKRMLLGAQALICLSLVGYGASDSIPMLLAVRLVHGVGLGCSGPLSMAFISEFLPTPRLAYGISFFMLAQSLSQVVGPALGLWLVGAVGFSPAFLIVALSEVVAMVGVSLVKEPPRDRPPYRFSFDRMFVREAVSKAVVLCLLSMAAAGVTSYVVLYGSLLGIQGVGAYFVVYALCLTALRPLFGKMADRFGAARVLLVGCLLYAVSFVMLWHVRDFAGLMAVAVMGSAGFGACAPLVQSMALASVPPERHGAAGNTAYMGLDLGNMAGPVAAGFVIEALVPVIGSEAGAYSAMWLVMLIPLACAFAVIVKWNMR